MGRTTLRGDAAKTRRAAWALRAGALLLSVAVVWVALRFEAHDAFWLDESWTGAVIGQPTWADSVRQIYWDVNAPLYYLLLRGWSLVAGLSDAALRAPSLACAAAVPLVCALVPLQARSLGAAQKLAWAAITGLWFPALCFAAEARCYALLLLVAALQTLAFARLLARPTLARALVWSSFAALAILVHYDALYLGAVQGLVYLGRHRVRALKTWPAALAFAPAFGWLAYHWPRIKVFADPAIAWYAPLRPANLPAVLGYLAGDQFQVKMFAALALSALSLRLLTPPAKDIDAASDPGAAWAVILTAVASVLAAVVLVGVGFLRPSFTFRYLTPDAPGLMLGVVLLARALAGRRAAPVSLAATALGVFAASVWLLAHGQRMAPRRYNFEVASAAIARARPARLVFLWDHPVDPVLHPEQLSALGGFFLRRDGQATPVTPVILRPGQDPNARLAAAAAAGGDRTAVLWLYDTWVHGTAAIRSPPDPARFAPALSCRDYGRGRFGVFACTPAPSGRPFSHQPDHQPWGPQPQGAG
jgi:hypothetical protein